MVHHISQATFGVPNNILYLQNALKKIYPILCCTLVFNTVLVIRSEIRKKTMSETYSQPGYKNGSLHSRPRCS